MNFKISNSYNKKPYPLLQCFMIILFIREPIILSLPYTFINFKPQSICLSLPQLESSTRSTNKFRKSSTTWSAQPNNFRKSRFSVISYHGLPSPFKMVLVIFSKFSISERFFRSLFFLCFIIICQDRNDLISEAQLYQAKRSYKIPAIISMTIII